VELRGTAELTGDPGKSLPRALSQKYLGEDPPPEPDELARVIVRVIPERVNAFSALVITRTARGGGTPGRLLA
jgi:hypothetical protein